MRIEMDSSLPPDDISASARLRIGILLNVVGEVIFKMNYWLICLPKEDLEHCMKVRTFGLSRKQILGKVKKGDSVICCAGKGDWKIIAIGSTTSDYYLDDKKVFLKEGSFPDRFDFKAEPLPKGHELDLMSIIDRLCFVTNLAYWAVHFRNGIVSLSKQDFDLISNSANAVISN